MVVEVDFFAAPPLCLSISRAVDELTRRRGRAPKPSEIAAELRISREEVHDGLAAGHVCHVTPLDQPIAGGATPGGTEAALAGVDDRAVLSPLIMALPEHERLILTLRFVHDLTHSQIAARLGVCQPHVSELLAHTLENLREGLRRA